MSRRAFSLIEAAVSIVIVGLMLSAALNAAGASRSAQSTIADRLHGAALADMLMSEILSKSYEDPVVKSTLGREAGETAGPRSLFDDVDDYAGWTESPIKDENGVNAAGLSGWAFSVDVAWVHPDNFATRSLTETGVKIIVVTVQRRGVTAATLTAIKAKARELQ